jgi:NAD(P)-dependent dehydrogenase (short-subunit alcohol dehydrogenase family)
VSDRPLEGRRAAVLGAAGNAGPAMVAALASAGASVAGVGRDAGLIEAVEGIASAHAADLLDPDAVRRLAGELGDVDVVVHLVGGWRGNGPIAEVGDDEWAALEGPLFGTVLNATRAFAPALARSPHGRFLLVSSQQAQAPTATNAVYATAKAAAEAWTLALADEFRAGESAATANILVVKAIVTDAMRAAKPEGRFPGFTSADALAQAAVFACADAGAAMNGQRLELHS